MRRHAEHAADGHDTGAADTGDDDRIGLRDLGESGFGERRQIGGSLDALAALELGAFDGDEPALARMEKVLCAVWPELVSPVGR